MINKIISIDLKADFGFLKKPDINEGIYLTYNMLHKPVLLGILGAIIGLEGYQERNVLPEYYQKLKNLKVGFKPLNAENGNFLKTVVQYNNGVGYASQEAGGNLIIKEQVLIKPVFRCYLGLTELQIESEKLLDFLKNQKAEFLPYLGKNDFSLWWDNFLEYQFENFQHDREYQISTLFIKSEQVIKDMIKRSLVSPFLKPGKERQFIYFEELPIGFDNQLMQYEKAEFVFTNCKLDQALKIDELYELKGQNEIIQLF